VKLQVEGRDPKEDLDQDGIFKLSVVLKVWTEVQDKKLQDIRDTLKIFCLLIHPLVGMISDDGVGFFNCFS
jgi:hypothetical protein